jgi:hypothetical protein
MPFLSIVSTSVNSKNAFKQHIHTSADPQHAFRQLCFSALYFYQENAAGSSVRVCEIFDEHRIQQWT